jgi:hypothetical protein
MAASRIFELRTYHAHPGRLDALHARFRDHTMGLFDKHGFTVVGFWTPVDDKDHPDETLVYLLAFDDRDAAHKAWSAFRVDPDWIEARANSEKDGPIVASLDSVFLNASDYSPLT